MTAPKISITDPLTPAWYGMRKILFAPFDMGKWFVLGFSAWLAALGESGGSFNANFPGSGGDKGEVGSALHAVTTFVKEHIALVTGLALVVLVVLLAVGIVFLWLRARGKFMFLDNVVHNRAEISRPWHNYGSSGNSLFVWMLVFGIIVAAIVLFILGGIVLLAMPCVAAKRPLLFPVLGIVGLVFILMIVGMIALLIKRYLEDFVVPIMYMRGSTAVEAWREFMPVLKARFWTFFGYALFRFLIMMAVSAGLGIILIITCCLCCMGILLMIPYIGTVILLPIPVFFRLYGLNFLRQLGAQFDCLAEGELAEMDTPPQSV